MRVAVLFTARSSVYESLDCDTWDEERDATQWPGGQPCVAHPPCRAWSSLRHKSKAPKGEKDLAIWALDSVRKNGGVLEHPLASTLWPLYGIGKSTDVDKYGGFSIVVDQFWFGHRARKATRLYFCGCAPIDVPRMPFKLGEAPCTVGLWSGRDRLTCRPSVSKKEYSATPMALAEWLLFAAGKTRSGSRILKSSSQCIRVK